MTLPPDFIFELEQALGGKTTSPVLHADAATRLLYSTDASLYQIEPLGVVFPRHVDELSASIEIAARYDVPVLVRGAGSSLGGQAVGEALILDCTRYLNRVRTLNPDELYAEVEPGVVLADLNEAAGKHRLQFGPDPASAERATIGGSIANNAAGAHSIIYGMAADHLLAADVILADGSRTKFAPVAYRTAQRKAQAAHRSREGAIYRTVLQIREQHADAIRAGWPATWRRASGYNLNYLLPWSPGMPPGWAASFPGLPYPPVSEGMLNLAPLLAGSEGTLAAIGLATVRLVPLPEHTVLGVIGYPSLAEACEDTRRLLALRPSAIELIPRSLIRLARAVAAYAHQLAFVHGDPAALLVVEFAGNDPHALREQARALGPDVLVAESPREKAQVWSVRKIGLGLLASRPGKLRSATFMEDVSVPVEHLGVFVRELQRILAAHDVSADFYGHASAGCLHIRPLLNLKSAHDLEKMKSIASQVVHLLSNLGGVMSGEHGDGIVRSEWAQQIFGETITGLFREVKTAFDPQGLLNPGKIVDPLPMDANLRYGPGYQARAWQPVLDFTSQGGAAGEAGLVGAIEMCNGAGVCRKSGGVMCPSFQATRDEKHSTRGRANLLRALISGRFAGQELGEKALYEALDLCLACKGCQAECPSGVDLAKLKYEFLHHYYQTHRRMWRDYFFGYFDRLLKYASRLAPLVNALLANTGFRQVGNRLLALSSEREFPRLAAKPLHAYNLPAREIEGLSPVLVLSDAFTEYFYPDVGLAAMRVLVRSGYQPVLLPVIGAGRTLISKGFLPAAQAHARRVSAAIRAYDPEGILPVVGLEPSEIYTLQDEYPSLLAENGMASLAQRAWMIDEFLIRAWEPGGPPETRPGGDEEGRNRRSEVWLHGHCYQKARPPAADGKPTGVAASVAMLSALGYEVQVIEAGCCGMAGAFGYEQEHYELSMRIGELNLLPAVRAAGEKAIIAASGVSCQAQISDGAGRQAVHPVQLAADALK